MVEWRNTKGQLSWIRAAIKGCPEFSVAQFPLACIPQGLVEELKINLTADEALTWYFIPYSTIFFMGGNFYKKKSLITSLNFTILSS